jgi:preprotein translocase subunit SecA
MSRAAILTAAAELANGRPYAERSERENGWHDRFAEFLLASTVKPVHDRVRNPARGLSRILEYADRHQLAMRAATDADLAALARGMRARLRRVGFAPALVGECFALVREAAVRTIGQRHYDPQLMGGWALLQGKLVEMATGEGKTIAATLPACTVALAGYPVHVITVNDYLAERDAEEMGPLYRLLGLTVGTVVQGMPAVARRQAYARSVTYCSNKELAFDYLRDRVAAAHRSSPLHLSIEKLSGGVPRDQRLVLRGLYFGIVDEADSVFIDDARTPLILSSTTGSAEEKEQCEEALQLAQHLAASEDYTIDAAERNVTLTRTGRASLAEFASGLSGVWTSVRAREELITQALSALILFRRDQHYVVADGKVQIVDESTGRVMPDRSWERGLHQLIEAKEGCEPTQRRETLARLTYQRLFRRYIRLTGMSGTAREVAREIRSVYRLDVVRIPLHRPLRREYRPTRVCATEAEKWRDVADAVERVAVVGGRPVLIGTRSVRASEEISAVLRERGIEHALLNAKQDREEASIVALAGQPSRVTVATNMAGRGTDIRLGAGVAEKGGLHVILTEYHELRRVDRQFFGRCARQGDPGSCQAIVSLEDEIYTVFAPTAARLVARLRRRGARLPVVVYEALRRLAQFRAERRGAYLRVHNLNLDRRLDRVLAFSGRGE